MFLIDSKIYKIKSEILLGQNEFQVLMMECEVFLKNIFEILPYFETNEIMIRMIIRKTKTDSKTQHWDFENIAYR